MAGFRLHSPAHARVDPHVAASAVHLRLLRPGESLLVQQVFDQLSARARYLRFHTPTPRLTSYALQQLSAVEPGRHVAVVATLDGSSIAMARWIRLGPGSDTAELSVEVGDVHQRRGLGMALVAATATNAATHGISWFIATVHPENRRASGALWAAGAHVSPHSQGDLVIPVTTLAKAACRRTHVHAWTSIGTPARATTDAHWGRHASRTVAERVTKTAMILPADSIRR